MEAISKEHQRELKELLALYDSLIIEMEEDGTNKDNAQRLYNIYDRMSILLKEAKTEIEND